jgi:hypothetical protein
VPNKHSSWIMSGNHGTYAGVTMEFERPAHIAVHCWQAAHLLEIAHEYMLAVRSRSARGSSFPWSAAPAADCMAEQLGTCSIPEHDTA